MYCEKCGNLLTQKSCGLDGLVPFCTACNEYRFPWFNSAVSSIVLNPTKDKVLLIQQYGKTDNILVAGYITKGENAKETLIREIKEEVDLDVVEFFYNDNEYYKPSNTLIHNYVAVTNREDFTLTDEVDKAQWFTFEDAVKYIKPNSFAQNFLNKAIKNVISKL
jgi:NAD+ diphosphatase